MKELSFLFQKMIIVRLKNKIIFVLKCFLMKTDSISFKNYSKHMPVPFKIYADF